MPPAQQEHREPIVAIRDLVLDFEIGDRLVRVLHGVDLAVERGQVLGVVGESGCGKSVTWLAALGLLGERARVQGDVRLAGRSLLGLGDREMSAIRGRRIAMIFQDPSSSLNPVLSIGRQLTEALRLHRGLDAATATAEARRLLDRVGIANAPQRLGEYPHQLSGGMNQRVMIAMALAAEIDVLVADEPTTALDATIQAQILELLRQVRRDTGMALVLITHDLGVVAENADRVAVMYCGRVVEEAPAAELFQSPAHPYTQGLLAALPDVAGPRQRLRAIAGTVPEPTKLPPGCAFAPRCTQAIAACTAAPPALLHVSPARRVACIRAGLSVAAE